MRMLLLPLVTLCLQVPAKADKFWLSDPAAQKTAPEGSLPNIVEGVLIAESDEGYHVRIVGGEVLLPKKSVFRIEKDDLSIATIVKQEQAAAERAAAAPATANVAPATARRKPGKSAAKEATARREEQGRAEQGREEQGRAEQGKAPAPAAQPKASTFDPVIGREVPPTDGLSQADLMAELQLAWTMTKDKRYLVALRQLRRMR